jgi:hypothetical protein
MVPLLGALPSAPTRRATDAPGLATRTGQTERMTDFPIPRICAALALDTQGDEAMSMLNRRNALTAVIVVGALGLAVILGLALAELVRVMS